MEYLLPLCACLIAAGFLIKVFSILLGFGSDWALYPLYTGFWIACAGGVCGLTWVLIKFFTWLWRVTSAH